MVRLGSRSEMLRHWFVWAFLIGWLGGALYMCLLAIHWLFDVPWKPWLGMIGAFFIALLPCGFIAYLVGLAIHEMRVAREQRGTDERDT